MTIISGKCNCGEEIYIETNADPDYCLRPDRVRPFYEGSTKSWQSVISCRGCGLPVHKTVEEAKAIPDQRSIMLDLLGCFILTFYMSWRFILGIVSIRYITRSNYLVIPMMFVWAFSSALSDSVTLDSSFTLNYTYGLVEAVVGWFFVVRFVSDVPSFVKKRAYVALASVSSFFWLLESLFLFSFSENTLFITSIAGFFYLTFVSRVFGQLLSKEIRPDFYDFFRGLPYGLLFTLVSITMVSVYKTMLTGGSS